LEVIVSWKRGARVLGDRTGQLVGTTRGKRLGGCILESKPRRKGRLNDKEKKKRRVEKEICSRTNSQVRSVDCAGAYYRRDGELRAQGGRGQLWASYGTLQGGLRFIGGSPWEGKLNLVPGGHPPEWGLH